MVIRKLLAVASAVAAISVAAPASAAFGVFTASPGNLGFAAQLDPFQSDYIAGNYSEVVTLTPSTATTGLFSYSLLWRANEFQLGGNAVDNGNGNAQTTGLGLSYSLYATLKGTGSYSASSSNPATATVTFTPALGSPLALNAIAGGGLGTITAPIDGTGDYTFTNANTVMNLISGSTIQAQGSLKPCNGTDCGSFGQQTTVNLLSPNGTGFFTLPRPFFDLSFEAGNFNQYWLTQIPSSGPLTSTLGGGAQVTFNYVPEPAALSLVGFALFAAGLARRRHKA